MEEIDVKSLDYGAYSLEYPHEYMSENVRYSTAEFNKLQRDGDSRRFAGGAKALPSDAAQDSNRGGCRCIFRGIPGLYSALRDGTPLPHAMDHVYFRAAGARQIPGAGMAQGRRRASGARPVDGPSPLDHHSQLRRIGDRRRTCRHGQLNLRLRSEATTPDGKSS